MADLIGVTELAARLNPPRSKGTISKHAEAGKIPVAARTPAGAPLFDLEVVQAAYDKGINTMMRRQGGAIEGPAPRLELEDEEDDAGGQAERRSGDRQAASSAAADRGGSGLQGQLVIERRLRNRRLVRQLGEDENRLILRTVAEEDQETLARRTRDSVTSAIADKASAAYAFAGQPRTEAEWRVWLSNAAVEAFNSFASALALEDGDEFGDEQSDDGDTGEPGGAAMA